METSKTYQYRKVMKPLLERKRRARINKCLDDLKDLMVECLTHEGEHIVRLEKADILELTVDYLNKIKQRKEIAAGSSVRESFRSGYVHAVNEVSKILASTRGVDVRLGTTLMTHLGYRLNQIQGDELGGTLAPRTSTPIKQKIMSPLKIDLDSDVSGDCQLSPASSGYHSQLGSPVASEGSFSMTSEYRPPSTGVWRPW